MENENIVVVTVREVLERRIEVNLNEIGDMSPEDYVKELYDNEEIVLDSSDHIETIFD